MTTSNQHIILPLSGLALLLCLLLPVASTYLYLQFERYEVRRMVKHELMSSVDRSELTLIVLTAEAAKTELDWEHPGEFEYRGQMYDLADSEIRGDSVYYWCWWDHKETALNRQLEECIAHLFNNHPVDEQQQQRLIRFYLSLIYTENPLRNVYIPAFTNLAPAYRKPHYTEPLDRPPGPPPDYWTA